MTVPKEVDLKDMLERLRKAQRAFEKSPSYGTALLVQKAKKDFENTKRKTFGLQEVKRGE